MSDLISRQAAIDALGEAPKVWTDSPEEFAALSQWEMDVTAIEAVPSAEPNPYCSLAGRLCDTRGKEFVWCLTCPHISEEDRTLVKKAVEPKKGRWMDAEIPLESGGAMPIQVCDQCSTFYPLAHTGGGYHFCPHCGADMREGDND